MTANPDPKLRIVFHTLFEHPPNAAERCLAGLILPKSLAQAAQAARTCPGLPRPRHGDRLPIQILMAAPAAKGFQPVSRSWAILCVALSYSFPSLFLFLCSLSHSVYSFPWYFLSSFVKRAIEPSPAISYVASVVSTAGIDQQLLAFSSCISFQLDLNET